jgi:hypothetical protein
MQGKVSRFHGVGKLLVAVLLGVALLGLWGCGDDTTTTSTSTTEGDVTNPNPDVFQPTGNIQGVIRDAFTGAPLAGARVSIDVPGSSQMVVTTLGDGQYSFTGVPASTWSDANGDGVVQFGELSTYTITVDLQGLTDADGNAYPSFAFGPAAVGFASFLEGNAPACPNTNPIGGTTGDCVEGGSGANTPIDGLTTTLNFDIGALTDTIRGRVLRDSDLAPLEGVRVTLFDSTTPAVGTTPAPGAQPLFPANAIRLSLGNAVVTTDANGEFSFPSVSGVHTFAVMAESAPNWNSVTTAAFATPGGGATTLVPATAAVGAVSAPGTGEIILTRVAPGMDTTPPMVLSATPSDGADIDVTNAGDNRQSFVFVFNESLSTDAFQGVAAAVTDFRGIPIPGPFPGTADGTVQVEVTFSTTNVENDTVTVTPTGTWKEGLTYGLFLAGLRDTAGNPCCGGGSLNALNTPVFGEVGASPATLLFTTNATGGAIAGPAIAQAAASTDFNDSTVTLEWGDEIARRAALPADDPQHIDLAQIRQYRVYAAVRPDLGGEYQLIWQSLPSNEPTTTMGTFNINDVVGSCPRSGITGEDGVCREILEDSIKDVGDDIDGDAATVDFSDGFNSVSFAVSIVNANGVEGSLGTALAAQDNTPPTSAAQVLADTDGDGVADTITITMSEPLDQTSAETTTNYALYDADGNDVTTARGVQFTAAALDNDVDGDGVKGIPLGTDVTIALSVASTSGGGPDIRDGDFVQLSNVLDLAAVPNANDPVDGTAAANQLVDMTAPRLTGGSVGSIVATFNEPMGELTAIPTVRIAGVDCTANGQVTVEGFDAFPADLDGATSVTLNVDPTAGAANPACDEANLDENSFVSFEGIVKDASAAGNVIDDNFDHLNGSSLEVSANPPEDTTPPTLDAVSFTDNETEDDTITLTFSEPLSAFALTSLTVGVFGPNDTPLPCPVAFISNNFAPGASEVVLTLSAQVGGICDLANLTNGNTIQLDAANTLDTGFPTPNPLSEDNDSATFDGTEWVVETAQ